MIAFATLWYIVSNVPNPIKMIHFDRAYQRPIKERFSPYQSSIKLNAPPSRTATHAHLLHLLAYPHPLDSPIHSHAIIYSNLPRGELKNNQWCPLACSHPLAFAHLLAYPHLLAKKGPYQRINIFDTPFDTNTPPVPKAPI